MRRRPRVVLYLQQLYLTRISGDVRQWILLLPFVAEHNYRVESLTNSPDAAEALATAGLVDLVVCCIEDAAAISMREHGVVVETVRRPAPQRPRGGIAVLIQGAHQRGVNIETIATCFGVTVEQALLVLATPGAETERSDAGLSRPESQGDRRRPVRVMHA